MKPVAELLKKRAYTEVYSVGPTATVFEAITLLAEKGVGALMVMDQGKLVEQGTYDELVNRDSAMRRLLKTG